jgi:hypothetical protein
VRTDAKLAAIEVLRALQADDRPATAEWADERAAARSSERCGVAPYVPGLARGRWKS